MAIIPTRIKKGTRAQLNAAKAASTLAQAEPYLITDEGRLAVGTAANTFADMATKAEVDAKTPLNGEGATGTWPVNVSGSAASVDALPMYSKTVNDLPNAYPMGVSCVHVRNEAGGGWFSYGTVLTVKGYSAGGGTLQVYVPYSPTYGGTSLKFRCGNYDVNNGNGWSGWRTLIDDADARLTNARPASDVYAWAKAAAKPGYSAAEVGIASLVPPFIISPLQGTSGHLASVTLVASGYQPTRISGGTHVSTDWEVSTTANFSTIVKSSYSDTVNKTAWTVTGLNANTTYYWRVRYTDSN